MNKGVLVFLAVSVSILVFLVFQPGCNRVPSTAAAVEAPAPKHVAAEVERAPVVEDEQPAGLADAAEDLVEIVVHEEKWPNDTPRLQTEGYWDEDGNFVRHGLTTAWYESGLVNSKVHWRHGVPHGDRTTWYFDGQIWAVGHYDDGLEDGTWTRWHQTGAKHSEWTMNRGAWNGVYTEWHENGKMRMQVEFINGLRQGPMNMWDEQGVLTQTADFVDNVEQP